MKLTDAQRRALAAMPLKVTMWGGKPWTSLPKGVRYSSMESLRRRALCEVRHHPHSREIWNVTDAGRRALAEAKEGE